MSKIIEEQAKQLAQILIGIGETRLSPDEKQKHAEIAVIHALRTAKADGMDEGANLAEQEASASTYAPHASGILHIEYLIRAAAQKVRDGK